MASAPTGHLEVTAHSRLAALAPASANKRRRGRCAPSGLGGTPQGQLLLSSRDHGTGARSQTQACQEHWFSLGIWGRGRDSTLLDLHKVHLQAVESCAFCLGHPEVWGEGEGKTHTQELGVSGPERTQPGGPNSSQLPGPALLALLPPAGGSRLRKWPQPFGQLPLVSLSQNRLSLICIPKYVTRLTAPAQREFALAWKGRATGTVSGWGDRSVEGTLFLRAGGPLGEGGLSGV